MLLFRRLLEGVTIVLEHFFDCFLASAAILSHAAARVDIIRANSATQDRGADALLIEPIADTDNHPISHEEKLAALLSNKCE